MVPRSLTCSASLRPSSAAARIIVCGASRCRPASPHRSLPLVAAGHPPTPLDVSASSDLAACAAVPLASLAIGSGQVVTVEVLSEAPLHAGSSAPLAADRAGIMRIRRMPDDNSCLFHAVGALLLDRTAAAAGEMRALAVAEIRARPETYTEALLGRPPAAYASLMEEASTWGGAIEISAFAAFFAVEIAAVDVQSGRIDRFGEGCGHANCAYILYNGIHYDAIVQSPVGGDAVTAGDRTVFPVDDIAILSQVLLLAEEARRMHRYTDVAHFTLACLTCGAAVVGEGDARQHSRATGHQGYAEYAERAGCGPARAGR